MTKRTALVGSAGVTLALAVGALALVFASLGGANPPKQSPPRSTFTLAEARAFQEHPVHFAGDSVEGYPLVAVLRRNDTAKYVSFVYGDCYASSDNGCAPPVEIQSWPACKRHLALYDTSVPGTPTPEMTSVRGVPGAFFDDGQRLEVHTGRSLVVIFADSRDRVLRVARALRGANVGTPPDVPLPAPAVGAVDGKLSC
jgi:hypothetical protein